MKLPIITKDKVTNPLEGFGFAFIDEEDKKLKIKKHDSIIEFSNTLDNVQLLDLTDYTAWEIMCNWEQIYGANSSTGYEGDKNERTGYRYAEPLPYSNGDQGVTAKFTLRTTTAQDKQDVIVDWGDGTFSSVRNGDFEKVASSYNYTMSHKYEKPAEFDKEVLATDTNTYRKTKRYTIKVYGKQYYGFVYTNLSPYNLMCRCLDWDLPVASHITNMSSFATGSKRLQKVAIPFTKYLKNFVNYSSAFGDCYNLISATGFANYTNKSMYACNWIFSSCKHMTECDFIFPELSIAFYGAFNQCNNFAVNIAKLFPKQGFLGNTYSVRQLFEATKITGTIPAYLLWENKSIEWIETSNAFSGCPDAIRAQVPVSWGGTNTSIDTKLAITDEMKADYTAFEVYPTDHDIVAGSFEIGKAVWNDESLITTYDIPASMIEEFSLKITRAAKNSDIIIDWGDGTVEKLSDISTVGGDTTSVIDETVVLAHTYSVPNKVYTICVYGKDYRSIRHTSISNANNKLLCRIFNDDNCDLPIASHLTNLSSFCIGCTRLLKVDNPEYSNKLQRLINIASLFEGCKNLLYAYGFKHVSNDIINGGINNVFSGCNGLLETDFKLPTTFTSARNLFYNCERLEIDIALVFSNGSLTNITIDPAGMFAGTKKLFGIVPAEKLWNNTNVTWKTYSSNVLNGGKPFIQSSEEIRAQVPISWGGTASEDIIEKSLEEKYNDLLARIEALEK